MRLHGWKRAAGIAAAWGCACAGTAERICFDFETGDLQGWQVVEGGFGRLVSDRAAEHHVPKPYTKEGRWFLSTLESKDGKSPDDSFTGTVESPVIVLSAPRVRVKVGGGAGRDVAFSVCTADGAEAASARGGNSQTMVWRTLDVPGCVGKAVYFRVSDGSSGGWGHLTVDSVSCEGEVDRAATEERFARRRREAFARKIKPLADRIRAAVRELGAMFPSYPLAEMLAELGKAEAGMDPGRLREIQKAALVRDNPLLNGHPILFTTRAQYRSDHHNTATIFQTGEVNRQKYDTQGAMKALDVKTGAVRVIVPELPGRTIRDPELDYDGRRIVFSMREGRDADYKIWTVNADGSGLRRLTSAPGVADIDPVWLPDGGIVFSSTREPKYCMCNRHIMCNLYRMEGDGANIIQIGKSTLFEGHSALLPDGRVLYDRWEYVDRNFGDAQGLWVCNPDGTGHAIYWGNNTTSPGAVLNARPLDGGSRVIAVFGACHDRPWGALGIIDRSLGADGRGPVLRTWPENFRKRVHTDGQDFDSTKGIRLKYNDPFPLDASHFLCTRMTGRGEETGLVYLDLFGNEVMFYEEAPGCHSPMPIRAAPRKPPARPVRRNFDHPNAPGVFCLQNVYIGTHMKGVAPGSVKALRIVESPEKRHWTGPAGWNGQGEEAAAMNWHSFENKRILGTVPVEPDGSACFEVPGNTFVFFQALDGEGKMVQSMRSGAYVQPGERYGCVGCHENRTGGAAPAEGRPAAMARPPDKMNGWHGPARLFSYQKEVQPVFTRHCAACHDYGKPAAAKLNLSGGRDVYFCTSYVDLWATGAIRCVGGGPAEIRPALSWGSHASKLTDKLDGHGGAKLSPEEKDRIITWMDLNAVYYPSYACAYPGNPGGRSPLTYAELGRLTALTGVRIARGCGSRQRSQLNFDRPGSSRILEKVRGAGREAACREALELIRQGGERLRRTPRADMDGFVPCAKDRAREAFYARRLEEERRMYEAVRKGEKRFDGP